MSTEPALIESPVEKSPDQVWSRVWSIGQISFASIVGGPIAGVYLMSRNAKVFGKPHLADQLIFLGFVFSTIIFTILFCIPTALLEQIPKIVIPVTYTALVQEYARHYQKESIHAFIAAGNKRHSYWKLIPYTAVLTAVSVAWGFLLSFAAEFSLIYIGIPV